MSDRTDEIRKQTEATIPLITTVAEYGRETVAVVTEVEFDEMKRNIAYLLTENEALRKVVEAARKCRDSAAMRSGEFLSYSEAFDGLCESLAKLDSEGK